MAVWERGAGQTLACGTGACATVVAGVLEGRTERKCRRVAPHLSRAWERDFHLSCCNVALEPGQAYEQSVSRYKKGFSDSVSRRVHSAARLSSVQLDPK